MRLRLAVSVAVAALLGASCAGEGGGMQGPRGPLTAVAANYDLAAGVPSRFLVGLETRDPETGDALVIAGGTATVRFSFLGATEATGTPRPAGEAGMSFLLVEGTGPVPGQASAVPASVARGVYAVPRISFETPGIYEARVSVDLGGDDVRRAPAAFQVLPEPLVPAPGDPAPKTENLTVDSTDAPPGAVDSRAEGGGKVPDPELHDSTVADDIRAGRPVLVVISTPVYCVSRFCGPITDMIQGLAADYSDRADFIHIEVWRDFQGRVVNRAAADWVLRDGDITEPWVFLVGGDGRIEARWDNVVTRGEIEPLLQDLPPVEA